MTQQSNTGDSTPLVSALADIRPPDERHALTYRHDEHGNEELTFDEPVPVDQVPDDVTPVTFQPSLAEHNEDNFVIVRYRCIPSDQGEADTENSGVVKLLAPDIDLNTHSRPDTYFDTWQDAEAFIAEHFDQPDAPNDIIRPYSLDDLRVQKRLTPDITFVEHTPADDAFAADTISIDQ